MLQNAVACEHSEMTELENTASTFLRDILGIQPTDCFLSDESDLDDFSLMGSSLDTGDMSWDDFILDKIQTQYGITLSSTRVNLVSLFNQIERTASMSLH